MKRFLTILIFAITCINSYANMSSPYTERGRLTEVYSSRNIDIINEQLNIKILDPDNAFYDVTYTIRSDKGGIQVPLLFDTMYDRTSKFRVWVDSNEIEVKSVPYDIDRLELAVWQDSLRQNFDADRGLRIEHFKYLEVNLSEGVHTIHVQYEAQSTINRSGWIRSYFFEYNLEPARNWRSFKNLNISLDVTQLGKPVSVDMNSTTIVDSIQTWHFAELPNHSIRITYQPETNTFAKILIAIDPAGIMMILFAVMVLINISMILKYRKKHPKKKFSPPVVFGPLLVPFITGLVYMFAYAFIDLVIGDSAAGHHGYVFFIFLLYPIVMLVYLPIAFFIDLYRKRKLNRENK